MSLPARTAALLAALVLAGCGLAGCVPGAPVTVKTTTVAEAIRQLPGVTDVTVDSQESTYYTAPRSDVYAGLTADASADDVAAAWPACLAPGVWSLGFEPSFSFFGAVHGPSPRIIAEKGRRRSRTSSNRSFKMFPVDSCNL